MNYCGNAVQLLNISFTSFLRGNSSFKWLFDERNYLFQEEIGELEQNKQVIISTYIQFFLSPFLLPFSHLQSLLYLPFFFISFFPSSHPLLHLAQVCAQMYLYNVVRIFNCMFYIYFFVAIELFARIQIAYIETWHFDGEKHTKM